MTGAELIKWIQDNHAEELEVWATDDLCDSYRVHTVSIERYGIKQVVLLDE